MISELPFQLRFLWLPLEGGEEPALFRGSKKSAASVPGSSLRAHHAGAWCRADVTFLRGRKLPPRGRQSFFVLQQWTIPRSFFLPTGNTLWYFGLSRCSFLALQEAVLCWALCPCSESSCLSLLEMSAPLLRPRVLGKPCVQPCFISPFREAACSSALGEKNPAVFVKHLSFPIVMHPYYQIWKPETKKYFSCPPTAAAEKTVFVAKLLKENGSTGLKTCAFVWHLSGGNCFRGHLFLLREANF